MPTSENFLNDFERTALKAALRHLGALDRADELARPRYADGLDVGLSPDVALIDAFIDWYRAQPSADNPGSVKSTATATCQHCGRTVTLVGSKWLDLNATGDDVIWRETCDTHDTFTAEHEPMPGTPDPAPKTWTYSQVNAGGADVSHEHMFTGTDAEWAEHLAELTHQGIEPYNAKITAPVTALGDPDNFVTQLLTGEGLPAEYQVNDEPVTDKLTLDQVIDEATAMGLLDDEPIKVCPECTGPLAPPSPKGEAGDDSFYCVGCGANWSLDLSKRLL
jgi:hypothetical protein